MKLSHIRGLFTFSMITLVYPIFTTIGTHFKHSLMEIKNLPIFLYELFLVFQFSMVGVGYVFILLLVLLLLESDFIEKSVLLILFLLRGKNYVSESDFL